MVEKATLTAKRMYWQDEILDAGTRIYMKQMELSNKEIEKAPIWCSVDLRDGNQALYSPMTTDEKLEFFDYLVKLGFKEIEVGFPAASETEYNFLRALIEQDLIPDDTPVLGHVDDLAILAAAFMVTDPELNAYSQWREENGKA